MNWKRLKMNKQGQIDSVLTWFIAIFIIMFILIVYLIVAYLMAEKKSWTSEELIINEQMALEDIGYSESFFAFLNSEIEIDGKQQKTLDVILSSFDAYFNIKSSSGESLIDKYGLDNADDITRTSKAKMISDGFNEDELSKIEERNLLLAKLLREKINFICEGYKLGLPFGLVNNNEENMISSDVLGDRIFFVLPEDPLEWTKVISYKMNYRGKQIKIEYIQLKKCLGEGVIGGQN